MRTLRTSVRRLVEFLLRAGDIDSDRDGRGGVEAMLAGGEIHRALHASAGDAYQAEVPLAGSFFFPGGAFSPHATRLDLREEALGDQEGFFLAVEGRADGIIDDGKGALTIDEIKGVARDVSAIEEPEALHEAQALCYAYLYLRKLRGPSALATAFGERVTVRVTYASMTTGEVRQLERSHAVPDIEAWFFALLAKAERWAAWRVRHDELRTRSLSSLAFPFVPRDGQREIMDAVEGALREGGRLYLQAPTGSGKTVATLFPALKALGAGKLARVAYLTAKTTSRRAVLECLEVLGAQGMSANVLVMTARDKICPLRRDARGSELRSRPLTSLCNPVECPLARGHYDAVGDALYEAISSCDVLDARHVEELAARHHVCPYELQRDAARWSDLIVCDYHYAFAPSASLIGLADEPGVGDTAYLVDEAHNLAERMREMYSAELAVAELEGLERLVRERGGLDKLARSGRVAGGLDELARSVRAVIAAFPTWDQALPAQVQSGTRERGQRVAYQVVRVSEELRAALAALVESLDATLERLSPAADGTGDGRRGWPGGRRELETFLAVRDLRFKTGSLVAALQRAETGYVSFLGRAEGGGRKLKVFCLNPRHDLEGRLEQARAAVFFSGTLLPLDYHRKLLAARDDDPSLYARSSFDPRRQQVLIASDISARFSRRGPELYARIAAYLTTLIESRPGNYLAFLPSYAMLDEVARAFEAHTGRGTELVRQHGNMGDEQQRSRMGEPERERLRSDMYRTEQERSDVHGTELVRQHAGMREAERERFVDRFRAPRAPGASLLGLCVLGGIFGEGIDLPGEALVGVVVVGTGMPQASAERELIREHFDAKEGSGFAYAYTYPGMSKVLQAAGRLIRSEEDHGVVLLLDDRFLEPELQAAFPREWQDLRTCTLATLPTQLADMPAFP